eukprot:1144256-Pelagomonas_calceolata.AAC.3
MSLCQQCIPWSPSADISNASPGHYQHVNINSASSTVHHQQCIISSSASSYVIMSASIPWSSSADISNASPGQYQHVNINDASSAVVLVRMSLCQESITWSSSADICNASPGQYQHVNINSASSAEHPQGRSTSRHVLNNNSSRSHCVFTVHVEIRNSDAAAERAVLAKLNLVDLAGSERTKKTNATGQRGKSKVYEETLARSLAEVHACRSSAWTFLELVD